MTTSTSTSPSTATAAASRPVQLEGLTKLFRGGRGITEVNLSVEAGQVFGFLGPNGAGKTTTIRCILGLHRPTRGRAEVLGADASAGDPRFLADVGYLPGELRLPERLTGADIVGRFANLRGLRDLTYARSLAERFDADLDRPLAVLSKGSKQKIGIVLAFMHRPHLLVLDEPTSGLDPLLQNEFDTLLRETADDGRTVFLSSHDLSEVERTVDRVAIIRDGRIVADDTVDSLRAAAPLTVTLTFDHDVDLSALAMVPGVEIEQATSRALSLNHTGSVAPLLAAIAPLAPDTLTAQPAGLDQLFLHLYGKDAA